jgi:hypothetical protein
MCECDWQYVVCPCNRGDDCPQASRRRVVVRGTVFHHHPTQYFHYIPDRGRPCAAELARWELPDGGEAPVRANKNCPQATTGFLYPEPLFMMTFCHECVKTCVGEQKPT